MLPGIRRQEINQVETEEGRQMERETWLDWKRRLDEWEERRVAAARENRPFIEELTRSARLLNPERAWIAFRVG